MIAPTAQPPLRARLALAELTARNILIAENITAPPPPDAMIGKPSPDKYDGAYYEKLGRGMLVIKFFNIEGREGRMKELIDYMRRGTAVCN